MIERALELIEACGTGHVNLFVPNEKEKKAIAVRWTNDKLFIEVNGNGRNAFVELTREEMLAIGIACIRQAQSVGTKP